MEDLTLGVKYILKSSILWYSVETWSWTRSLKAEANSIHLELDSTDSKLNVIVCRLSAQFGVFKTVWGYVRDRLIIEKYANITKKKVNWAMVETKQIK